MFYKGIAVNNIGKRSQIINVLKNHPVRMLIIMNFTLYFAKYVLIASGYNGTSATVVILCPLVCLLMLPYVITMSYGIFALLKKKNLVLLPSIIVIFWLTYSLPLPPLPKGKDAKHFFQHRTDYEFIIEQAKSGRLQENSDLFWRIEIISADPLVVALNPYDVYGVVVYAEREEYLIGTLLCDINGRVYDQLGNHWWVCFVDSL